MSHYNNSIFRDAPELIELCTHCKHADCIGTCPEYRAKMNELMGIIVAPPNVPKPVSTPRTYRGSKGKLYEAFGEVHNLKEWSEKYGMSYTVLCKRIRTGWPIEEALTCDYRHYYHPRGRAYTIRLNVNGMSLTLGEWAREMGIPRQTIYMRLKLGWTAREALYGKEKH